MCYLAFGVKRLNAWVTVGILDTISKNSEWNFTQFLSQMYLGSQMCWLDFGTKRSIVKVTAGNEPKNV